MLQFALNLISWKIVEVIKLVLCSSVLHSFWKWLLGHSMLIQNIPHDLLRFLEKILKPRYTSLEKLRKILDQYLK